ncbi:hypothetical protein OA85_01920 [Flavobacterium sp. AED]|nr:hypothetical protein OA85_01920 [Flavobacterium sp. AED]
MAGTLYFIKTDNTALFDKYKYIAYYKLKNQIRKNQKNFSFHIKFHLKILWQRNCASKISQILYLFYLVNFTKKTIFEYFIK